MKTLRVYATLPPHEHIYRIDAELHSEGKNNAKPITAHVERSVGAYFDEEGYFAGAKTFLEDIKSVLSKCEAEKKE
jgi:hypothetical protein